MIKRAVVTAGLTLGAIVVAAGPAFAHVEAEPGRVKPGKPATVDFTPEHGCGDDSPTTKLTFQVPKRVTDAAPVPLDGWETSTSGRTIEFEGGPLPYEEQESFGISFTAPKAKTVLTWKIIQTCEDGKVRWIERGHDSEYPAPVVGVGKNPSSDEDDDH
jgi:uncharacterized protein YcnI